MSSPEKVYGSEAAEVRGGGRPAAAARRRQRLKYAGVRGKQGKKKDKYQGCTPRKKHRTGHYDTPLEAAIAFAQLREDLDLGMLDEPRSKKAKSPKTNAAYKKKEVGVYLGHLLQLPRPVVLTVACVLLSEQQAAAAAARCVPVAMADVVA